MRKLLLCFAVGGTLAVGTWMLAGRYGAVGLASWRGAGVRTACSICTETSSDYEAAADTTPAPKTSEPAAYIQVTAAPTPIIIRDEEPTDASEHPMCLPETSEAGMPAEAVAASEPASVCPLVMPYCTDETDCCQATAPKMPHADEACSMKDLRHPCCECGSKPSCETSEFPWPAEGPACQEDGHYHDQYPGVPYVAPQQAKLAVPAESKVPYVVPGQEECKEPGAAPKLHKSHYPGKGVRGDGCPYHPEVDTMEYRKSDGNLNEYGPGGPM